MKAFSKQPFNQTGGIRKHQDSYRIYAYADGRWVSNSNNSYGQSYYQMNVTGGTAVDPVVSWAGQGWFVNQGVKLKKLTVIARSNNVQLTELEIRLIHRVPDPITRWETGMDANGEATNNLAFQDYFWTPTDPLAPVFTGNTNDMHKRTFKLDYTVPDEGFIIFAAKSTGATATRYWYATLDLEVEY